MPKRHTHQWVPLRKGFPHRICRCGAFWARESKIGKGSITASPAGVGDVIRWSGTQAAIALGDLGMDVATGRPAVFVGGVSSPLAVLSDVGGSPRIISSGATVIPANTTLVLATPTRNAGERISFWAFPTDDVANIGFAQTFNTSGSGDRIELFFRRTAVADQFEAVARNDNNGATPSRTLDWAILGVTP